MPILNTLYCTDYFYPIFAYWLIKFAVVYIALHVHMCCKVLGNSLYTIGLISSKKGGIMGANRITRGILIGGALGAFSVLMGIGNSMFISVGVGMVAGFFAGYTMMRMDKRREAKKQK